ncbi:MAG: tRNA (5-methylaminomethyl-2-thiouridine)(34)-methyltransferase MnmD [Bacteroidales bacterium]
MSIKIILTEDGSVTLFNDDLNEVYHSKYGAINESRHVFIQSGLKLFTEEEHVSVLEIGMGTGLNILLTFMHSNSQNVNYTAIEPFPPDASVINQLNYPELLDSIKATPVFKNIHQSAWNQWVSLDQNFALQKIDKTLQLVEFDECSFHLVYFDAFSPDVQPELWSEEQFIKIFKWLKPGGVLVTYSSRGAVKRALQAAGFSVEKIPGPKGKREIIRAFKLKT